MYLNVIIYKYQETGQGHSAGALLKEAEFSWWAGSNVYKRHLIRHRHRKRCLQVQILTIHISL